MVQWGAEASERSARSPRSLARLTRDRRLPPVIAGLGGAAAFASLVGEWLVMTVPDGGSEGGAIQVAGTLSEVGGFGIGYLVGLLGLAGAVTLTLRGTAAVRANARLCGLALAGMTLAVLAATAFSLDDSTTRMLYYSPDDGFRVEYGRGLVMAFVAVLLVALALQLASEPAAPAAAAPTGSGRTTGQDGPDRPAGQAGHDGHDGHDGSTLQHGYDEPGGQDEQGGTPLVPSAERPGPTGAGDSGRHSGRAPWEPVADETERTGWRWRRRTARGRLTEDGPPAPADLTVEPTVPFARPDPPHRP